MTLAKRSDRRRHARAPFTLEAILLPRRGPPVACAVENLSAGGALLCTVAPLDNEGLVRIRLRLSERKDLTVSARVVRRYAGDNGEQHLAVAFADLPPRVQDMVQAAALRALASASAEVRALAVDDGEPTRGPLAPADSR